MPAHGKTPVTPDVAIDHEEGRVAQQWQGMGDATRSFEGAGRFGRIRDAQPPSTTIAQCRFDFPAQMGVIDDDFMEPGHSQSFKMPDDQRLSPSHQQGFWRVIGQWPHSFAASGGKEHGFHGIGKDIKIGILV